MLFKFITCYSVWYVKDNVKVDTRHFLPPVNVFSLDSLNFDCSHIFWTDVIYFMLLIKKFV